MRVLTVSSMAPDVGPDLKGGSLWDEIRNGRIVAGGAEGVKAPVKLRDGVAAALCGGRIVFEDGSARLIETGAEEQIGQALDGWVGGTVFGDLPVLASKMLYRHPSGAWRALPGWPSEESARLLAVFRNHLIAADISTPFGARPFSIRWSHPAPSEAIPSDWRLDDPTSDAGEADLPPGGEIKALVPLSEWMAIVREASIWRMRYVGAPFIFAFEPVNPALGGLAAVASRKGFLWLFTGDDLVAVAPTGEAQSVLEGKMRYWVSSRFRGDWALLAEHPSREEVWLAGHFGEPLAIVSSREGISIVELPEGGGRFLAAMRLPSSAPTAWDEMAVQWDEADSAWDPSGRAPVLLYGGESAVWVLEGSSTRLGGRLVRRSIGAPFVRTLVLLARVGGRGELFLRIATPHVVAAAPWAIASGERYDLEISARGNWRVETVTIQEKLVGVAL